MFPIYIVTDKRRIEPTADKVICVLTPEEKPSYLNESAVLKERRYKVLFGRNVYEIVCPEIQKGGPLDARKYLVIPEFLIPGRPYPIYVYIYGMVLYSSNPKMGQREAAEKTRKRFDLETFSHTTLGRAMKKLEARIKTEWDNEANETEEVEEAQSLGTGGFPSVEGTVERRDTVLAHLKEASSPHDSQLIQEPSQTQQSHNFKRPPYNGAFIDACHRIVDYTLTKYGRLLL